MKKLSVVIPLYNEEANVSELYSRLDNALRRDFDGLSHEFLFVNDGSSDQTLLALKSIVIHDENVKIIDFSRNFGHHLAITAGLDHATGDYIVMMDGDLQDQPEEIVKLYKKLLDGFDVVYGKRLEKQFSYIRRFLSRCFLLFIQKLVDQNIVINTTIFRIMTRHVASEIKRCRETNRYLVGIIGWVGFSHTFVDVIHGKRLKGVSKYNFRRQMNLALDAIFSFSDYPLHLIAWLGCMIMIVSICLITFIIIRNVWFGTAVVGWASLFCTILFMGGVQIFLLGIVGEYVGRSYVELKQRPLYVIRSILQGSKEK